MKPIADLLAAMQSGSLTSRALIEQYLAAAATGEGPRVYLQLDHEKARRAADSRDRAFKAGIRHEDKPLLGLPVSIKDLCDVIDEVTLAGSIVLKDSPAAKDDAPIVKRLRAAGAIPLGTTNMTEFAFSGLGINPHYGTPANPWDRASGARIPGGSSSGAVVSVTDGMAAAAIGSDTGGSIRIPAALCGATGFKPTKSRVPTTGAYPLSHTLDSLGPIAPTVACCALIDAVLAGEHPKPLTPPPVNTLKLGVLQGFVLDSLDKEVAAAYQRALTALSKAGAQLEDFTLPTLDDIPAANSKGTIPTYEGYDQHKDLLATHGDLYDPIVRSRMMLALNMTVTDYSTLLHTRQRIIAESTPHFARYDAVLLPTVACIAPRIAPLEADLDLYLKTNWHILRNPSVFNFLDGCGLSIPIHHPADAPVGLMIAHLAHHDAHILNTGAAIEAALSL